MTSTMFSNYQANYYEPHENLSLQEMMDCDMHEMDFLSYDPLLQETVYSSPDFNRNFKQEGKLKAESNTPSPGDLTNLQWLQNVSIPMEKTTPQEQKQLMVDPNTGLPPQYTSQGTPLQQHFQHRPQLQPQQHTRIDLSESPKTPTKPTKQLNGKPGEKVYPKPVYSYSCLIAMALKNSDSGTLPVSEIYKFMQTHFPYFKTAPDGWKNSVRHNLSLNKAFCKLERPQGSSQRKGCLWSLKPEKREQMEKEIRKWKKKHEEALREHGIIPDNSLDHLIEASPEHIVPQITEIDDRAAADAAKELFGNDLLHDMQDEELWKEIMSSAEGLADPVLTAATTAPTNRYTDPTVTTVEIDSSSQYFNTVDYSQMNGSPYINSNYYTQANTLNVNGF